MGRVSSACGPLLTAVLLSVLGTGLFRPAEAACVVNWTYLGLGDHEVFTLEAVGSFLFAGTDSGLYKRPLSYADTVWTATTLDSVGVLSLLPLSDTTLLVSALWDSAGHQRDRVYRSTDQGGSWTLIRSPLFSFYGINRLGARPDFPDTVYLGQDPVLKSIDGGLTWNTTETQVPGRNSVVVSPFSPATVWAGGENFIYSPTLGRSEDGGRTWSSNLINGPENAVRQITLDPVDENRIYLCMEGLLVRSTDGGASWDGIYEDTYLYFSDLEIDPADRNRLFVTGRNRTTVVEPSLLVSGDGGTTWQPYILGIPEFPGNDIELVQDGGATVPLVAGSGVYRVDIQPARVWHVPSEVPTIQAALDSAATGCDTVDVAAGVYQEQLTVTGGSFVLRGAPAPDSTVLSGALLPPGASLLTLAGADMTMRVTGFTFADAGDSTSTGGALYCDACNAVIEGNRFRGNRGLAGGAIRIDSGSPTLSGNTFRENRAWDSGGAVAVTGVSKPLIRGNVFLNNRAAGAATGTGMGGALAMSGNGSHPVVQDNVFLGNTAGTSGAVNASNVIVTLTRNTIARNVAEGTASGIGAQSATLYVDNNIVAMNDGGWGIEAVGGGAVLRCNDFWQNTPGDFTGVPGGATNFFLNPLFCDPASGNVSLAADSPCLQANSGGCGLVGALGQGCGLVPVGILDFHAERMANGTARIAWSVASSLDRLGFDVYRETGGSARHKLTDHALGGRTAYTFIDATPPPEGTDYWLAGIDRAGGTTWYGPAALAPSSLPARLVLGPAHPNPFRSGTRFTFEVPSRSPVRLRVFDAQGREVCVLLDATVPAGPHEISWDGSAASGQRLAAGIYLVRLETPAGVRSAKLVLSGNAP